MFLGRKARMKARAARAASAGSVGDAAPSEGTRRDDEVLVSTAQQQASKPQVRILQGLKRALRYQDTLAGGQARLVLFNMAS